MPDFFHFFTFSLYDIIPNMNKLLCFFAVFVFAFGANASDNLEMIVSKEVSIQHQPESFVGVEELFLAPSAPNGNLWSASKEFQEKISFIGCPFQTNWECNIWKRKPTVMETIALPARHISKNGDYKVALLKRYNALMQAGRICCIAGMESKLKNAGATPGLIYKFMVDDANFYGFGDRCLMTTDEKLEEKYPQTATAAAVSDVRDTCLCQRRDYFDALLAPFDDFPDEEYEYSYHDGLKREIKVSVSEDVRIVKEQLTRCPK